MSAWLASAYGDIKWMILDTAGAGSRETVNFDVRMADGRSLLDHPELLATAKEFTYWIREGNYTRIDDAARHKQYAETMIRLCYRLTARGMKSVSDLTSIDIDIICEDATAGLDGVTTASKILKDRLSTFETWDEVPAEFKAGDKFVLNPIINAFNLPRTWGRIELNSELVSARARLNGKLIASVADSKDRPVTIQNVQLVTTLFEALHALRHYIEAPSIKFRPFPEGAAKRADDLGRTTDRTPIPHPDLVLSLLEQATRFVATNCESIVSEYQAVLEAGSEGEVKRAAAFAVHARIEMLATACFILIAAFTARRAEEIKQLERNCIDGNDETGWWMKVYIEKTERAQTWIPIPRIVARVVRAVASFRETDAVAEDDLLWDYFQPILRRITKPSPEGNVNEFAKMVGCHQHANDNGPVQPWHWQTRQFRRFFAVLFFYRYKGKIETLAHHLRHFNLEMTNDYLVLDPEVSEIWTREHFRYQVSVARDLVSGRTNYSGPMGERLNRLVEKVRATFEKKVVILTETMARIVVRTMKKQHLVLTPKPWVDCSCPRDRRGCENAACRKVAGSGPNDLGPDFSAAGPTICPGCPWALFDDENINFFDKEIEAMKSGFVVEEHPTIFAELQSANIVKLSSFRESLRA
ncbi:hypothetical protein [Rhizobium leguminosarum]|uniref:hypothetical protein n=1 Tax=Rhizobium leguminosarum TaxID=384 RepID=UPI003F98C758